MYAGMTISVNKCTVFRNVLLKYRDPQQISYAEHSTLNGMSDQMGASPCILSRFKLTEPGEASSTEGIFRGFFRKVTKKLFYTKKRSFGYASAL